MLSSSMKFGRPSALLSLGLILTCGLAFSSQSGSQQKEPTPPSVVFRARVYKINNEKRFKDTKAFANIIQNHDTTCLGMKSTIESGLQEGVDAKTIKLVTSPVMKSLLGIRAVLSNGDGKTQLTVRAQADMLNGHMSFRFLMSNSVFDINDKTNEFYSSAHDGPFRLTPETLVAMYTPAKAGKPSMLTVFEGVLAEREKL